MKQQSRHSCRLVDFGYVKDKAVGVYAQDTTAILADAQLHRDNQLGQFDKKDLDMRCKLASIPKILWLKMQQLIDTDNQADVVRFLQRHLELTGENYFTTTMRL
jgi:hypothetical protein